jgi:hypothetical protein
MRCESAAAVLVAVLSFNCGGGSGPCGLPVETANDDRDHATAYTLGDATTGCIATATDQDWLSFSAPSGAAGGYFTVKVDNVGTGAIDVTGYATTDNGQVFEYYADNQGESVHLFFPAIGGAKYLVELKDFSGFPAEYKYTFTASYTAVNDTNEPNDTRATAKPMTVGATGVSGFLFSGFKMGASPLATDYDDYFSVTLAAGDTTVSLAPAPSNLCGQVFLLDSTGAEVASKFCDNPGQSLNFVAPGVTAGSYFVRATVFLIPDSITAKGDVPPNNYVSAYTLTVTQ